MPLSTALVQIVGTPVACSSGVKESWREVATWAETSLTARFGDAVKVVYYDLFDPACPTFPQDAQIPVVLINHVLFSSGGKISVPAIRKYLEGRGG